MYRFSPVRAGQRLPTALRNLRSKRSAFANYITDQRLSWWSAGNAGFTGSGELLMHKSSRHVWRSFMGRVILRVSMVRIDSKYGRIQ